MDRGVGKDQAGEIKKRIIVGAWGGSPWDDGSFNGVREITLFYSLCIDSITVVYDQNGKPYRAEELEVAKLRRVLPSNFCSHYETLLVPLSESQFEIKLQFPQEHLMSVSSYYCPVVYGGTPVIRSLTFSSNKRTFGVDEGTPFTMPMEGGQIVGFKGRSGWYLDAIGFYIANVKTTTVLQKAQKSLMKLASSVTTNYRYGDEQNKYSHYYRAADENQTKNSKK